MGQINPFEGFRTCTGYARLALVTLLVFAAQVAANAGMNLAAARFGLTGLGLESMLPALLTTAAISWAVLHSKGVPLRPALADWGAHAGGDFLKALKYLSGYVAILAALMVAAAAAYYLWAESADKVMAPVGAAAETTIAGAKSSAAQPPRYLLLLFTVCVATPLAEELFFRRVMFTSLRAGGGFWPSAVLCSAVFAFFHGITSFVVFPVGLYLCWVYERERRLPVNIMLHGLMNLMVTSYKTLC